MDDNGPCTKVYSQINPLTGEHLGRAPRTATGMRETILANLEARCSAPYTDVTVSWSKSISLFHASIRENERLAREAGDENGGARLTSAPIVNSTTGTTKPTR